ncbi:MAG: trehalose-phosphatase [Steroidobacteraceae bacterium]
MEAAMHAGGPVPAAARPPQVLPLDGCALFLDLDGTLLEFAPRPDAVSVEPALLALLHALLRRAGGALAVVSGRSIATLDTLLAPLRLPLSGLHGFERRDNSEVLVRHERPNLAVLQQARHLMAQWVTREPRLVIEDKGLALALHYRQAPHLETAVVDSVTAIAARPGSGLRAQRGRMVVELTPGAVSKATAIAEFMRQAPFQGRRPLYVGDDLTDEPAFEWVNAAGGISVAVDVAPPTSARAHLGSVREVRAWLRALLDAAE